MINDSGINEALELKRRQESRTVKEDWIHAFKFPLMQHVATYMLKLMFYRVSGTGCISGRRRARLQLLLNGGGNNGHAEKHKQTQTSLF